MPPAEPLAFGEDKWGLDVLTRMLPKNHLSLSEMCQQTSLCAAGGAKRGEVFRAQLGSSGSVCTQLRAEGAFDPCFSAGLGEGGWIDGFMGR